MKVDTLKMVDIGSVSKIMMCAISNLLTIALQDVTVHHTHIVLEKIKPFKKMLSHNKVNLLSKFGEPYSDTFCSWSPSLALSLMTYS